jgi:hypothetical protein
MMSMTPATATAPRSGPATRRLVLVPAGGRSEGAVRHFRLARLRLEDREVTRSQRFDYLKRSHD